MPGIIRRKRWGSVIEGAEEDEKIRLCEKCLKLNIHSVLKNRLYLDSEGHALPPPPDSDSFLQCHKCGYIYPVGEIKVESEISTTIEVAENPFEIGKIQFAAVHHDDRLDKGKDSYKKRKKELAKIEDIEVREYLAKGYKLVRYESDSAS